MADGCRFIFESVTVPFLATALFTIIFAYSLYVFVTVTLDLFVLL